MTFNKSETTCSVVNTRHAKIVVVLRIEFFFHGQSILYFLQHTKLGNKLTSKLQHHTIITQPMVPLLKDRKEIMIVEHRVLGIHSAQIMVR